MFFLWICCAVTYEYICISIKFLYELVFVACHICILPFYEPRPSIAYSYVSCMHYNSRFLIDLFILGMQQEWENAKQAAAAIATRVKTWLPSGQLSRKPGHPLTPPTVDAMFAWGRGLLPHPETAPLHGF